MVLFATIALISLIFPGIIAILVHTKLTKFDAFNDEYDFCFCGVATNAVLFGVAGLAMTIIFFVKIYQDLTLWYNLAQYYYTMIKTIIFFIGLAAAITAGIVTCIIVNKESCIQCCFGCRDKLKDVKKETDLEANGYNKDSVL